MKNEYRDYLARQLYQQYQITWIESVLVANIILNQVKPSESCPVIFLDVSTDEQFTYNSWLVPTKAGDVFVRPMRNDIADNNIHMMFSHLQTAHEEYLFVSLMRLREETAE